MIVSDTSPLNYLVLIEQIDILAELYERVLIPQAVYRELSAAEAPVPVQTWISSPPVWLEVSPILLQPEEGLQSLHAGERDAITLALQSPSNALIIDERHGRNEAEKRQIKVIGTLGILAIAHEEGLLDLRQALARLRQTTFHVSPRLLTVILQRYQLTTKRRKISFDMKTLDHLLAKNREWAHEIVTADPEFFQRLSHQQSPEYLWIGCSDSRVPANQIVGLLPGELFVHRNVANVVVHTDLNCLSVLQYAIEVLKVKHVIVCGHYGCGGVLAALQDRRLGLIDNWLRHIQDVALKHRALLSEMMGEEKRHERLCELNVIEQVCNVVQTTVVQQAWEQGQDLTVHGWIYSLNDGLLRDLQMQATAHTEPETAYHQALTALA